MSPMPQPVEPVPARGSARRTGSASGPTATRHWRPAVGGPRQRAQKGGPRRGTARGGQAGANGQANAARPARGTYGHCAWAGCRMAQANQAQAAGRTSELRRVHGGPLAAWRASANGRAAPASSGGSTPGHWLRGGRMRTAGPRQRAQEGPRRATGRAWRASLCERSAKAGLCSFGMRAASAGQISIVATSSTACQARGLVPSTEHAGRARVTPAASSREGEATGSSLLSEAANRCKA